MNLIGSGDELVSSVSLYRTRHPILHGYTSPFLLLYSVWIYQWLFVFGYDQYWEVGAVAGAVIFITNILTLLSCYWSVHCLALNTCVRVSPGDLDSAEYVKVVPTDNNGAAEMVRLARTGPYALWFTYQKLKFEADAQNLL